MPDNNIKIGATVDVATLQAGLKSSADATKSTLDRMSISFQEASATSSRSMRRLADETKAASAEARGALMVLDEEIGLHLPRHVTGLVSQLPGLSAALASAFPVIAVIALGKAITELIEKHEKEAEAARHAAEELVNLQIKEAGRTSQLEVMNLKLEDQIAKLEGRPTTNHLREALLEAKDAADGLATSLSNDIFKGIEVLEQNTGFFQVLKDSLTTLKSNSELETTYQSLKNVASTYQMVIEARTKLAEPSLAQPGNEQKQAEAVKDLSNAFGQLKSSAQTALGWIEEHEPDNTKVITALKSVILESTGGMRDMGLEVQQLSDRQRVALLENLHAEIDEENKKFVETKKLQDAETKEAIAGYELQYLQGRISAEDLANAKQAALDKEFAFEQAHLERVKELEAKYPELVRQTQAEEDTLVAGHNAQIISTFDKTLEEQKKGLQELEKFNLQTFSKIEEEQTKASDQALRAISANNKKLLDDFYTIDAAGDRRIAAIDKEIANLERLITQYHLQGQAAANVYIELHKLELERQKDLDQEMLASNQLGKIFHATIDEMIQDGLQWKTKVGALFKQTVDQMNSQLASFVATGKINWQQLATSAIEGIVKIALQWVESHILMLITGQTFQAQQSGMQAASNVGQAISNVAVGATEALATVPYPANIAAAADVEAVGAGYIAQAATLLEVGTWNVPGVMPAVLHPGEMVVPRFESDIFRGALAQLTGATPGAGHTFNINHNNIINTSDGPAAYARAQQKSLRDQHRYLKRKLGF